MCGQRRPNVGRGRVRMIGNQTASCAECPVRCLSVMSDTGNELGAAAGGRLPRTGAERATGAQVVAVAAGILAMACGLLMLRDVGYTAANLGTGVSFVPDSITVRGAELSVALAAAAALVAVVGLALRGRARWLRFLQIGLWLLALASSVYIAGAPAPFTSPGPLVVGDIAGVVAVVLLTLSLRRPASRQPRWHLALSVLAAVALLCIALGRSAAYQAYGPGSGILTGIVAACSPAAQEAAGDPNPSQVVTGVRAEPGRADRCLSAPATAEAGSPLPHEAAAGDLFDHCRLRLRAGPWLGRRHGVRPGRPGKRRGLQRS